MNLKVKCKLQYMYHMYYHAIKKNKVQLYALAWKELQELVLCEENQAVECSCIHM